MYKLPLPDPEQDRIMICGNPNMIREFTNYLKENDWNSTSHRGIGNFTVEKAFVIKKD
jgi:ferredoxin--NADP+ reductase